ncbi:hypothetical protein [Actinomadura miaoliensis]|uniref:DUF8033 domain-containing protein n=1 Tax=Actinomadura miaoliensis TaxID=430685 RepID=A0ABP7X2A4_9ACTN
MAKLSIRYDVGGPDGPLAHLQPFDTHGAMSATPYAPGSTGRLPLAWARRYDDDRRSSGIIYTVRSYATPIAWVRADGRMVVPPVTYSPTTTRHQNLCRAWLGTAVAVGEDAAAA